MSLLDDLRYLFTAPSELFYDLDENPRFLRPLVVNLLLYFISVSAAHFWGDFFQMSGEFSFLVELGILVIMVLLLGTLAMFFINALQSLGYFVGTKVLSYDVSYKSLLSIAMYAFIILSIGKTLETLINSKVGINDYFSFSPAFFLANTAYSNSMISALLKLINPFTIWYVLLMACGISVTSEMGKGKAIGVVILGNVIFWIIFSLIGFIIYALVFIVTTLLR
ncbi:MAG: YIP1 family protein [Peptostreptococcaceae bacterium]|nr:YIP1 family protein [Peptostreptococcaceae bacterium]